MTELKSEKLGQARALKDRGDFESAANICDELLERVPDDADVMTELAGIYAAVELFEEALGWADKALEIDASYVPARLNRALALRQMEKLDDAMAELETAVSIAPSDFRARFDLGLCLQSLERHEDAVAWLQEACKLSPDHVESAYALAKTFQALKRNDHAIDAYRNAVALAPDRREGLLDFANLLVEGKEFKEATTVYQRALDGDATNCSAWLGLGAAFLGVRQYPDALTAFQRAIALKPGSAVAYCNMSLALCGLGRIEEAIEACRYALFIEPGSAVPSFNMGTMLLSLGRFREGWEAYNYRHGMSGDRWLRNEAHAAPWTGEDLTGKSILVLGEQGNGDEIQFSRYVSELCKRGASVTFLAPQRLHRLFQTLHGDAITLISELPDDSRFDFQCPLMTLPGVFEQEGWPIPNQVPYLAAEPDRVARWKAQIGDHSFKIGLAWQGHDYGGENIRSFPLAELEPIAQIPGVRLISLQLREGTEQLSELPHSMVVETLGDDYDRGDHGFLDAAAACEVVDLVISCDTSMCHLAGALGRPVWLALNEPAEWRWQSRREDTIWYPTARLFRQPERGDWASVFRRITEALPALMNGAEPPAMNAVPARSEQISPQIQVSWGELLDKLSILEIKTERLTAPASRANVRREMDHLRSAVSVMLVLPRGVERRHAALRAVNEKLWNLEDAVRTFEAEGEFGGPFIEAARSIYSLNDERARLKREINELLKSDFIEEKQHRVRIQGPHASTVAES